MPSPTGLHALRSLTIFRHLAEPQLAALADALAVRTASAGTVLFEEGSPGDALYVLSEGEILIDKHLEAGGMAEIARLHPGDIFGEMALIERQPRSARAMAATDAVLLVLGAEDLVRWLRSDAQTAATFFLEVMRLMSRRLHQSTNRVVLLFELSQLTLQRFTDEGDFLRAALDRIVPRLEGDWSAAAYLHGEFTDEVSQVGTAGPHGDGLPETLAMEETESRWLDGATLSVPLPGRAETPLGFLLARSGAALTPTEQGQVDVALTAAGQLLASALLNIRHDAEERLRARLQQHSEDSPF
jgi:CRP-like cAMP-binding protein